MKNIALNILVLMVVMPFILCVFYAQLFLWTMAEIETRKGRDYVNALWASRLLDMILGKQ
jgi:uncharacterized protein YebE (UPF0316 family)